MSLTLAAGATAGIVKAAPFIAKGAKVAWVTAKGVFGAGKATTTALSAVPAVSGKLATATSITSKIPFVGKGLSSAVGAGHAFFTTSGSLAAKTAVAKGSFAAGMGASSAAAGVGMAASGVMTGQFVATEGVNLIRGESFVNQVSGTGQFSDENKLANSMLEGAEVDRHTFFVTEDCLRHIEEGRGLIINPVDISGMPRDELKALIKMHGEQGRMPFQATAEEMREQRIFTVEQAMQLRNSPQGESPQAGTTFLSQDGTSKAEELLSGFAAKAKNLLSDNRFVTAASMIGGGLVGKKFGVIGMAIGSGAGLFLSSKISKALNANGGIGGQISEMISAPESVVENRYETHSVDNSHDIAEVNRNYAVQL